MVELTEIELFLPQLPASLDNLCILHAGDLHSRGYGTGEEKLYQVLQQGCDILIRSEEHTSELQSH